MKTSKDFGELISSFRKSQGLTQKELAGICNVGVRFIIDLENGKETCQLQKSLHIARMLGIKFTTNDIYKDKE